VDILKEQNNKLIIKFVKFKHLKYIYSMVHECNLNCHTIALSELENLGIDDQGRWMPFIFHMDMVEAAKLTSDDKDMPTYGCTTVYSRHGEVYIIDTPYKQFFELFKAYSYTIIIDEEEDEDSSDLEF
jgi:hypothetical protein